MALQLQGHGLHDTDMCDAVKRLGHAAQVCRLVFVLILSVSSTAHADGFRNPFQGAAASAQGNAFAAQADDPTAIFYNPAGMTQLHGLQNAVGVQFVSVNVNYTSPTGVKTQNERPFPIGLPPPGQFFLTANLKDLGVRALGDLSVGLGFLNLYGFALKYPESGPFASSVTFAQLPLLDIKPTMAYKLTDDLSVGAGFLCGESGTFLGWITCGSGSGSFLSRKALGIDLAYQAILFEKRTVTGNPDPNADGTYKTTNHVGSVTLRVNF